MSMPHQPVDVRDNLSSAEFARCYRNVRAVVMRGALADLPAVSRWSPAYLSSVAPDLPIRVKEGNVADGRTATCTLGEYCDLLAEFQEDKSHRAASLPYLHDFPLFSLIPDLRHDAEPFPARFLPRFFRARWWNFTQFFIGPPQAKTPFHFDTLRTHNLFFQIRGRKRFVIVPPAEVPLCYTYRWRWSHVDPEQPDYERYPLFREAHTFECILEPGDLLYLAPGTLHQVTGLTESISFNIDWHDSKSAVQGLLSVFRGMPVQNLRYNLALALGVCCGIPDRALMPTLRSYYYYISLRRALLES
jgi:Cupin-like domain